MPAVPELEVPVALFIFNRPNTTARVFEAIRQAKPSMLLVVADGPRENVAVDNARCREARAVVDQVDWPCQVFKNYSAANLGCRARMASGLDWVFQTVEEAILFEDDCVPHPTFFRFCAELLERYRIDERVAQIGGDNFQFGRKHNDCSYYFSRYPHCWGWASWRRAWSHFDLGLKAWWEVEDRSVFLQRFEARKERLFWRRVWTDASTGELDAWDHQWTFACMATGGLSIVPSVNLVSNIGLGRHGTHTRWRLAALCPPVREMLFPLIHPTSVERDAAADEITRKLFFTARSKSGKAFYHARRWLESALRRVMAESSHEQPVRL